MQDQVHRFEGTINLLYLRAVNLAGEVSDVPSALQQLALLALHQEEP